PGSSEKGGDLGLARECPDSTGAISRRSARAAASNSAGRAATPIAPSNPPNTCSMTRTRLRRDPPAVPLSSWRDEESFTETDRRVSSAQHSDASEFDAPRLEA